MKHIDIWHHFIRSLVKEENTDLQHVTVEGKVVDLFTKGLDTISKHSNPTWVCVFFKYLDSLELATIHISWKSF